MNPGQILWEATYPLYLQTLGFFFQTFHCFCGFFFFFFCVFVNIGPYGTKHVKTLLSQFSSDLSQTSLNKMLMMEYKILFFGDLSKKKKKKKKEKNKKIWEFDMFVNRGPYRPGNVKTLLLPTLFI